MEKSKAEVFVKRFKDYLGSVYENADVDGICYHITVYARDRNFRTKEYPEWDQLIEHISNITLYDAMSIKMDTELYLTRTMNGAAIDVD